MFISGMIIGVYLVIAALAAVMTYYEQLDSEDRSMVFTVLGFAACLFWPVTLMTVIVAAQRQTA